MEKRIIEIDLETARNWYNKGGELKKLALSIFNESKLAKEKNLNYEEICKKFEEKYPIGTVVFSSDSIWPQIIVSKPEVVVLTDSIYTPKTKYTPNTKIVIETKLICLDNVYRRSIEIYGRDELENVEIRRYGKCVQFDYSKWKETQLEGLEEKIKQIEKQITDYEHLIDARKNDILNYKHDIEHFDEMYEACIEEAMKHVSKD